LESRTPLTQLSDSAIGYAALKQFAEAEAISKRLTKDAVSLWFDAAVSSDLMLALANAMKLPDEMNEDNRRSLMQP